MKIDQILPSCGSRDAIGTEVQIFRTLIQEAGFESDIYAQNSWDVKNVKSLDEFLNPKKTSDILIQHFSTGSDISYYVARANTYHICRFHNVTPAEFFPKNSLAYTACQLGYQQIPLTVHSSQETWVDSNFNAKCLGEGPLPPVHQLAVLRDYQSLASNKDDLQLSEKIDSTIINLLVVGRVSRNKCLHDSLFLLKALKQHNPNKKIRILVCGILETDYVQRVFSLLNDLNLSFTRFDETSNLDADVVFMGSITDNQLATCYRRSTALLCMSEHEGFCVPLVEAMFFDIPILAHNSTAIPETCGTGAILVNKNNPEELFKATQKIIHSATHRSKLIANGNRRAQDYLFTKLKYQFLNRLNHSIQNVKEQHQSFQKEGCKIVPNKSTTNEQKINL
ncbi:MAG: glycosyltransferase [Oligoflexales bacterium]